MQVYVVETGSFGNCYLIEYKPKTYIMVDDGLPMPLVKQFVERNLKSSMNRITFCIISHLHGDHLMESNLFNEYSIPIYIPEENLITNEIRRNLITKLTYTVGKTFYPIPNVKITSFPVPHDSYNLGFRISIRDNGV
ncbi:hypothetical protein FACS1894166_10000 [Bacilli bacterium]|nr:hypothetical protein FACS1894166_10000 [Bacilli bacterium]